MSGRMRCTILFLLALHITIISGVPALAAQEPVFRLDMDSLNLQKGVSSRMVVTMTNAQGARIVSIDGFENFDLLSQSQSSSTNIINNNVTFQHSMQYTIMPKTAGEFILTANIEYKGQSYKTNSLHATVNESSVNKDEPSQLFVKTVLSHSEAYLGEKIIVTYELYSRYDIESLGFTNYVAVGGVMSKEMPNDQLKRDSVYIGGNKYAMYEIKQMIIDPIKPGEYVIPSYNLQVNVVTDDGMRGGFGNFFRSTTPMYLRTDETNLLIKQLPAEGRPSDFSGIVGALKLESRYSRYEMNYGDSFTLQTEASGNCNLDGMKSVTGGNIPGFTVYENLKNTSESVNNNQYYVEKAFEAILIPENPGDCNVPPISVSYFNPRTEKYETAEISGAAIKVLGDIPASNVNNGYQAARVETININQVNYAEAPEDYFTVQIQKELVFKMLIGLVLFLATSAGFLWLIRNMKKSKPELKLLYKQIMKTSDVNEIFNLFNSMIKHCYNVNLKASSINNIRSCLPDAVLSEHVADIMNYVESAPAHKENGHKYLKDKIKSVYTTKLRKV